MWKVTNRAVVMAPETVMAWAAKQGLTGCLTGSEYPDNSFGFDCDLSYHFGSSEEEFFEEV